MRETATCGIDVGTQGVRATVVDEHGGTVSTGTAPIREGRRDGRIHEQDPADWWTAVVDAVRQATDAAEGVRIEALALDATSGTTLVEHADGSAAGPALMYDDTRAHEQAARAQRAGQPLWSALGYRIQPAWALPKALWLNESGAIRPGDRVVHQSDHLVRRLVGMPVPTDTSNALKTGVDLRDASWPQDVLQELGLDRAMFPDVVWPGTAVGVVGADAARATGLPEGVTVRAGMTDGCAGQIAAGALAPGHWSSSLGTTLIIKGSTASPVLDPTGAIYCHRHPDGGWLPGGASSTGAGVLRDAFPDATTTDLDTLTGLAAELPAVAGATYPLVGEGERFPFVADGARGFLSPAARSAAERFAALCQGIAYVERLSYDMLARLGADTSGPVAFTGTPASNEWWNQLRCDVLGRPVHVPRSPQPAHGMAILAASSPGELSTSADAMVQIASSYTPRRGRAEQLLEGYVRLVESLHDRGWLDTDAAEFATSRAKATI